MLHRRQCLANRTIVDRIDLVKLICSLQSKKRQKKVKAVFRKTLAVENLLKALTTRESMSAANGVGRRDGGDMKGTKFSRIMSRC